MKVYRVVVEHWPTEDGQPWLRYYGYDGWVDVVTGDGADEEPPPQWVLDQVDNPQVAERFRYRNVPDPFGPAEEPNGGRGDLVGVTMPKPDRKYYLSASGAYALAADMRAFGAVVRVEASARVQWPADAPAFEGQEVHA